MTISCYPKTRSTSSSPSSLATSRTLSVIERPAESHLDKGEDGFDILLGRSKEAFTNPGNIRFRYIVQGFGPEYHRCSDRRAKSIIVLNAWKAVTSAGGRFCELDANDEPIPVTDKRCKAKIGHALRDYTKYRTVESAADTTKPQSPAIPKSTNNIRRSKITDSMKKTKKKRTGARRKDKGASSIGPKRDSTSATVTPLAKMKVNHWSRTTKKKRKRQALVLESETSPLKKMKKTTKDETGVNSDNEDKTEIDETAAVIIIHDDDDSEEVNTVRPSAPCQPSMGGNTSHVNKATMKTANVQDAKEVDDDVASSSLQSSGSMSSRAAVKETPSSATPTSTTVNSLASMLFVEQLQQQRNPAAGGLARSVHVNTLNSILFPLQQQQQCLALQMSAASAASGSDKNDSLWMMSMMVHPFLKSVPVSPMMGNRRSTNKAAANLSAASILSTTMSGPTYHPRQVLSTAGISMKHGAAFASYGSRPSSSSSSVCSCSSSCSKLDEELEEFEKEQEITIGMGEEEEEEEESSSSSNPLLVDDDNDDDSVDTLSTFDDSHDEEEDGEEEQEEGSVVEQADDDNYSASTLAAMKTFCEIPLCLLEPIPIGFEPIAATADAADANPVPDDTSGNNLHAM